MAEVSHSTLFVFESGWRKPHPCLLPAIRTALMLAELEFTDSNGGGKRAAEEQSHVTPRRCRAARMVVGLSEHDLGQAAGFRKITVTLFERGEPTAAAVRDELQQALEAAGAEFLPTKGNTFGARLREVARLTSGQCRQARELLAGIIEDWR